MITVTTLAALLDALANDSNAHVEINAEGDLDVEISTGAPFLRLMGRTKLKLMALDASRPHIEARESSQPHVVARGSSQPHVEARESSQPHVEAWASSQPYVEAWGSSQPRVVAWGSSQPHIEARESSQPHVEAWESSQPHVVARESSQPHVVAWASSQPHIEAWESSEPHVEARESSQPHVVARGASQPRVEAWAFAQLSLRGRRIIAKATAQVAVLLHGGATADGGIQIDATIRTPAAWCEYYGARVVDGVATLYKAVGGDFRSPRGADYSPGLLPVAPDWDGGREEFGGGLHFSPTPTMALAFHEYAERVVACAVALSDMCVHEDAEHPQKIKARGCCGPCVEVDRQGNPIAPVEVAG
jgi:hypothetical protein